MKNLIIDEETSKIIDDKVEIEFLRELSGWILKWPEKRNKKVKDTSINDLLREYLIVTYNKRRIEGYK